MHGHSIRLIMHKVQKTCCVQVSNKQMDYDSLLFSKHQQLFNTILHFKRRIVIICILFVDMNHIATAKFSLGMLFNFKVDIYKITGDF